MIQKKEISLKDIPTYSIVNAASSYLFLVSQTTSYTCGPAAFASIVSNAPNDKEMEIASLVLGSLRPSVLLLGPSFLHLLSEMGFYDRILGLYYLASSEEIKINTLNEKILEVMVKFENIPNNKEKKFKSGAKKTYETLFNRHKDKIIAIRNEDEFYEKFDKLICDPKIAITALFFNEKSHIEELAVKGVLGTPHWMVPLGLTKDNYYIVYDPATNGIVWLTKDAVKQNFKKLPLIGLCPQFLAIKK